MLEYRDSYRTGEVVSSERMLEKAMTDNAFSCGGGRGKRAERLVDFLENRGTLRYCKIGHNTLVFFPTMSCAGRVNDTLPCGDGSGKRTVHPVDILENGYSIRDLLCRCKADNNAVIYAPPSVSLASRVSDKILGYDVLVPVVHKTDSLNEDLAQGYDAYMVIRDSKERTLYAKTFKESVRCASRCLFAPDCSIQTVRIINTKTGETYLVQLEAKKRIHAPGIYKFIRKYYLAPVYQWNYLLSYSEHLF